MAKGLFGGLKGLDAFGKVSRPFVWWCGRGECVLTGKLADNGRCEGEDPDGCHVYVP